MDDKRLQKQFDLGDEQITRLRDLHGDWNGQEFVPTRIPLLDLIKLTVVDAVGD